MIYNTMHTSCPSIDVDSELRSARIAEFRAAYGRLTEIEEAEYLESRRTRQQLE